VPMLDLSVVPDSDEGYTLAIRHPSGALTFHGPDLETTRRKGGSKAPVSLRFRVLLRGDQASSGRRGIVSSAVKAILLKVGTKVVDALLPALSSKVEAALWKRVGLSEGWFKVDEASLKSGKLQPVAPRAFNVSGRALLFLHGTFSHAASAFKSLADTGFFSQVKPIYGDRIYAFNHFSVSKTPEENARELLAGLPDGEFPFDVITHSRGGLVLRCLQAMGNDGRLVR
jgi:hypothetical protein